MRILYLHQYFAFPNIHSSTRSYDLSKEFVKRGYKVIVITTTTKINDVDRRNKWNVIEREGIIFHVLTSDYSYKLSFIRRLFSFVYFMVNASIRVLKIDCDFVLATSTPISIGVPALAKNKFQKTPYIFEVRDVWPEVPVGMGYIRNKVLIKLLYAFEKNIYKNASYVVALSDGMKSSISNRLNYNNIEVIPNISEIDRFQNSVKSLDLKIEKDVLRKKIILYAGAFGSVNGIGYVAKMAKELIMIDENIVFFLIGVGKEKEKITAYCHENMLLNKNVFIFDPLPKGSLPYLYSICTLGSSFVIDNPVLWNNSANKFFDTLAAGKPVLINHKGWQAELIETENIGYVLPPNIDKSDINRFVEYINNDNLIEIQRTNALKIANQEFSLNVAVQKYMSIFDKIGKTV